MGLSGPMQYRYRYPRPAVSADMVLWGWDASDLKVLLIQRKFAPFAGAWALPGGFVDIDEDPLSAAQRELQEETRLQGVRLRQLQAYGAVERDPRTRVITVAHWGVVSARQMKQVQAGDDADQAEWKSWRHLPKLAFDHRAILKDAFQTLRQQFLFHSVGRRWLPASFRADDLAQMYSCVLQQDLEPRRLVRGLKKLGIVASDAQRGLLKFTPAYRRFEHKESFPASVLYFAGNSKGT